MNMLAVVACAGTLAMTAFAQESAARFERTTTSFSLTVKAPYEEAAPLFGPQGERAWAGPHWNPEFLYPRPASDVEGAASVPSQAGPMNWARSKAGPTSWGPSEVAPTSWVPSLEAQTSWAPSRAARTSSGLSNTLTYGLSPGLGWCCAC